MRLADEDPPFVKAGKQLNRQCGLRVWDPTTGEEKRTLRGHPDGSVAAVAFSSNGKRLASLASRLFADRPADVKLWDVASGEEVFALTGHSGRTLVDVAFSPDGNLLASASPSEVIIWDGSPLEDRAEIGPRSSK